MLETSPSELPAPGAADIGDGLLFSHLQLSHAHLVLEARGNPFRPRGQDLKACSFGFYIYACRMHPRNRYSKNKADFGELAEFRPSLKPFLVKRVRWRNSNTPSTRTPNAPPLATGAAPPTGTPDIPPTGAVLPTGVPDAPLTGNPEAPPTGTSDAGAPNSPDAPATLPTGTPYAPPTGTPDDPLIVTPEAPPTGTSSDAGGPNAPSNIIAKKFAYTLNFSNIDAIRELSCALLEKDFDLRVEIPVGCLVPTVPQKLNYIHWVEDLLSCGACEEQIPRGKDVVGIDVGKSRSLCKVG